jgi:hypothetical protein
LLAGRITAPGDAIAVREVYLHALEGICMGHVGHALFRMRHPLAEDWLQVRKKLFMLLRLGHHWPHGVIMSCLVCPTAPLHYQYCVTYNHLHDHHHDASQHLLV